MSKNGKRYYDRGYVDAADKIRVFIESRAKVMFVEQEAASSSLATPIKKKPRQNAKYALLSWLFRFFCGLLFVGMSLVLAL